MLELRTCCLLASASAIWMLTLSAEALNLYAHCCREGSKQGTMGEDCSQIQELPPEVDKSDRNWCLLFMKSCCVKRRLQSQCLEGEELARKGESCDRSTSLWQANCCYACQIGRRTRAVSDTCFSENFSNSTQVFRQVFHKCCLHRLKGEKDECTEEEEERCQRFCVRVDGIPRCGCDAGSEWNAKLKQCVRPSCRGDHLCSQKCIEDGPSVRCACYPGYSLDRDGRTCVDVDECSTGAHGCKPGAQECRNTPGSFSCLDLLPRKSGDDAFGRHPSRLWKTAAYISRRIRRCEPGYRFSEEESTCKDIDECAEGVHGCAPESQLCRNTAGSYQCDILCRGGYRYNGSLDLCEDVDECAGDEAVCSPGEWCVNQKGSYVCIRGHPFCDEGFSWNSTSCSDIDECSLPRTCDEDQKCVNTPGGYHCQCNRGFQGNPLNGRCEDINECGLYQGICLETQRCDNTIGSYVCSRITGCGTGYTYNVETHECEDDDECVQNTHNCDKMGSIWECENTLGSFLCKKKTCPLGQFLSDSGYCEQMKCKPGLQPGEHGCIDEDECANPSACRSHQQCINTLGSYECRNAIECAEGFSFSAYTDRCEGNPTGGRLLQESCCSPLDIDECSVYTTDCYPDQICVNLPGTYSCDCKDGYHKNARGHCEDVNECLDYSLCSEHASCENTIGSYRCNCKKGFKQMGQFQCVDINECTEQNQVCHHKCMNTQGSFSCFCNHGYELASDKRTCVDINECEDQNLCHGLCYNQPGSFMCSCPSGYTLGPQKSRCIDVDECLQDACPGENDICINLNGGYKCYKLQCPPGYNKDLKHANRCTKSKPCYSHELECLQQPLSYSYNYVTLVSLLPITAVQNRMELFRMRVPHQKDVRFTMDIVNVHAPTGVPKADKGFFLLQPQNSSNEAIIYLIKSIKGPQDIELQLKMEIFSSEFDTINAVSRLYIYVSRYTF